MNVIKRLFEYFWGGEKPMYSDDIGIYQDTILKHWRKTNDETKFCIGDGKIWSAQKIIPSSSGWENSPTSEVYIIYRKSRRWGKVFFPASGGCSYMEPLKGIKHKLSDYVSLLRAIKN